MRLKYGKVLVLAVIGVLLITFIPGVAAWGWSRNVTYRPIEHWLLANNADNDLPMGGMEDREKQLIIWPYLDNPKPGDMWSPGVWIPIMTTETYFGIIVLEELGDNIILVTVNLMLKDAPFLICAYGYVPVFRGSMDMTYQLKFTIDLDTYEFLDDEGNIEFMYWWYYVWVIGTFKSVFLYGRGSGVFEAAYDYYEIGDTAYMSTIHYMFYVEDHPEDDPDFNYYGLHSLIVIDRINFR